jgi:hypothetical protein
MSQKGKHQLLRFDKTSSERVQAQLTKSGLCFSYQALHEHLGRLRLMDLEESDRRGYQAQPQRLEEYLSWEETAAWPED